MHALSKRTLQLPTGCKGNETGARGWGFWRGLMGGGRLFTLDASREVSEYCDLQHSCSGEDVAVRASCPLS
jgi:hypothetical protein